MSYQYFDKFSIQLKFAVIMKAIELVQDATRPPGESNWMRLSNLSADELESKFTPSELEFIANPPKEQHTIHSIEALQQAIHNSIDKMLLT